MNRRNSRFPNQTTRSVEESFVLVVLGVRIWGRRQALHASQSGWYQVGGSVKKSLSRLLPVPLGTEFGYEEIVDSRLGITIKPGICRTCDKDISDRIGRNTVAIRFSTSHT